MDKQIVGILVGIPGSGKSTFTNSASEIIMRHNNLETIVVSSDDIREEMYGDASIQGKPADVFKEYYKQAKSALKNGYNVILDATNVTKKDRKNIYSNLGDKYFYEAFVFPVQMEIAKERNNNRDRTVPDFVIERMYNNFEFPYEDWIKIVHVIE